MNNEKSPAKTKKAKQQKEKGTIENSRLLKSETKNLLSNPNIHLTKKQIMQEEQHQFIKELEKEYNNIVDSFIIDQAQAHKENQQQTEKTQLILKQYQERKFRSQNKEIIGVQNIKLQLRPDQIKDLADKITDQFQRERKISLIPIRSTSVKRDFVKQKLNPQSVYSPFNFKRKINSIYFNTTIQSNNNTQTQLRATSYIPENLKTQEDQQINVSIAPKTPVENKPEDNKSAVFFVTTQSLEDNNNNNNNNQTLTQSVFDQNNPESSIVPNNKDNIQNDQPNSFPNKSDLGKIVNNTSTNFRHTYYNQNGEKSTICNKSQIRRQQLNRPKSAYNGINFQDNYKLNLSFVSDQKIKRNLSFNAVSNKATKYLLKECFSQLVDKEKQGIDIKQESLKNINLYNSYMVRIMKDNYLQTSQKNNYQTECGFKREIYNLVQKLNQQQLTNKSGNQAKDGYENKICQGLRDWKLDIERKKKKLAVEQSIIDIIFKRKQQKRYQIFKSQLHQFKIPGVDFQINKLKF